MFPLLLALTAWSKTVIVTDDQTEYSQFISLFSDAQVVDSLPDLVTDQQKSVDNLIVLKNVDSFGGKLKVGKLLEFINAGGNCLLAGNSEAIQDFAIELSADFSGELKDFESPLIASLSSHLISAHAPILYSGPSHKLSKKNELIQPILVGSPSSYSSKAVGQQNVIVSAFQSLGNARLILSADASLYSNKYFEAIINGKISGNKEFAKGAIDWVTQEKFLLRIDSARHHRKGETEQHGIYLINQNLVFLCNKDF